MQLSQDNLLILEALPLTEVMRNNGHRVVFKTQRDAYYRCPLPTHDDKDASFSVELVASGEKGVCAFSCKGCGGISGYGAISLQSQLLGGDAQPSGVKFWEVVTRLCHDFHLTMEGVKQNETGWAYADPVNELTWKETDWTDDHLRALGCSVEQRYAQRDDDRDDATGESVYAWGWVNSTDTAGNAAGTEAEGAFHQEERAFDAKDVSRVFGIYPVSEYTTPKKQQADGTMKSYRHTASESYPVFIIKSVNSQGRWRVKKYEPYARPNKDGRSYKWTWWYEGGSNLDKTYKNAVYGDCDVIDALYNKDIVPQDTSAYHNHPTIVRHYKNADGADCTSIRFRDVVICSGPRDAMQVYYHSGAHVIYPHSETAQILPITLHRLLAIAENVYILYDMDETGVQQARRLNLEYLQMRNIELPSDLARLIGRRNGKPCKDVSDFFEQYRQVSQQKESMRGKTINELFHNLMRNAQPLTFWKRTTRKHNLKEEEDGQQFVYELLPENILQFLKASGMGIFRGKNDEELPRYVRVTDNIVRFIKDDEMVKEAKTTMKDWLSLHARYNDTELRSLISKSSQVLSKNLLEELPTISIDPIYWGPTWDYLFFSNGALRVTAEKKELIPYGELDFLVNAECILPRPYIPTEEQFEIVENPNFSTYEQQHAEREAAATTDTERREETIRWNKERVLWPYKLELKAAMNDMPAAFQFLYDTGRHYWKREQEQRRQGVAKDHWLTAEQRQYEDMQFVNKAAGIGYVLSRFRQVNIGRMAYLIDYSVDEESKSQGGTGKSIIPSMLRSVRYECHINGKGWKTSADMSARNFVSYDYLKHGYINIEDLKKTVDSEELYNVANSDFNRKRLNKDEETIRAEYAAKVFITSNGMFDQSEASTRRRLWTMLVGNYYHEGNGVELQNRNPYDKFGFSIGGKDMPEKEWDAMVTMLVQCLQFYLSQRTYIEAPMGEAGKMRMLKHNQLFKNDQQFPDWIKDVLARDLYWGIPLPKLDLCISYMQYCGRRITKGDIEAYMRSPQFGNMLRAYCDAFNISYNPSIVKHADGKLPRCDVYQATWNADGTLSAERTRQTGKGCYLLYRRGEEPTDPDEVKYRLNYDPGREGYTCGE